MFVFFRPHRLGQYSAWIGLRSLHFHHLDPSQKRHEINAKGVAIALDKLRVEAQKCVLLCSNCHAEVEDGTMSIPEEALDRANLRPG